MVRYLSTYLILGEYRGEPFETDVYTNSAYPEIQKILQEKVRAIKESMLQGIGFSRTQKQVIDEMVLEIYGSGKAKANSIAEKMGIAPKTLRYHNSKIIEKAREVFPLNTFDKAQDVVRYLMQQNIV